MPTAAQTLIHSIRLHTASALSEFSYPLNSILAVSAGELTVRYRGRSQVAASGSLVLLPAGERVNLRGVPGMSGFQLDSIEIPDPVMDALERQHRTLLAGAGDAGPALQIVFPRSSEVAAIWAHMAGAISKRQPAVMVDHWLQGVLLQLVLDGWPLPFLSRADQSLRRQVERLLTRDLAHEWSAGEVATATGMSAPTLRRRLAAEGTSYRALLDDARMSQALEMLMSTDMPIGHVAHAVGYRSASRFSSRFTARYGITPRMLRSVRSESAARL